MTVAGDRILTTHTGSLPRPARLQAALFALDHGEATGLAQAESDALVRGAVCDIVDRQVAAGVDIVSDGEMGKVSYVTYVSQRASGFGGEGRPIGIPDADDFPGWGEPLKAAAAQALATPACIADVVYRGTGAVETDIANLRDAVRAAEASSAFMSAASPGVISLFLENQHYPSHEAYLYALADAMKFEYDAIYGAGFLLQLDCPDLAAGRAAPFPELSLEEWQRTIRLHIEALNHATRDVPPEAMRLHLCWGNYNGPHHKDVPLADVLEVVLAARPSAISFEAANPRHAHEWELFEEVSLPEDKVLIPGVIDSTTSYIEHPELVAQRIRRFAGVVGRERVTAGTDCGFGTFAGFAPIDPDIVFAKLRALRDGADLASERL